MNADKQQIEQSFHEHRPEVDARAFAINYLSMSPEGFSIVTDRVLPKVDELHLNKDQKRLLGEAVKREVVFNNGQSVRDARDAWKADPDNTELEAAYFDARSEYQKKGKKIGLRNLRVQDGVIHTDVQLIHFPAYVSFAKPEQPAPIETISRLVGTAMVVRTADDRFVIQHRARQVQRLREVKPTRGNVMYSDVPGASVAGMFDASFDSVDRQPGTPDRISTPDVMAAIFKEGSEELGLAPTDFTNVRITGVAEDKIKVHDEILLLADTPLTAEQLNEASRTSIRNKNLEDADFEEKFFDIPASSEAVMTLLTQVRCPLPPTHAAALLAAGFSLALEEGGHDYALAWRDQVERGVHDNYDAIDDMVADYYAKFPHASSIIPERYWGRTAPERNLTGYDPAYAPEEQGLPTLMDAMVEAGLLPETRDHVSSAYLFDVDGPISDPNERRIVEVELIYELIDRLRRGEPIALNSGRSVEWMERQVVTPLMQAIGDDVHLLERFVVIGEKGGAWLTFDAEGQPLKGSVASIVVPKDLHTAIDQLVKEKYADCVAELDPKVTMVSLEMLPGFDHAEFVRRRVDIARDLSELLVQFGAEQTFSVDATTIAVDVESRNVGKHVGADRFLQHMEDLGVKADQFDTFGDSPSDAAMADELVRRGKSTRFVYVGNDAIPEQSYYSVVTPGIYGRGTLNFLRRS